MANASRQSEFDTGQTLLEASLEGEFDYIYNCLNGTNSVDVSINGDLTVKGGDIDVSNAQTDLTLKDNTNAALKIQEATTAYIDVDTTNGSEVVGIVGNDIIKPDQQLTTADFPNSTTLYIYNCDNASSGDLTDVGGNSKTLTLTGTTTAANDVLGVSRYNVLDGSNDYFSSTDAAFNFTDDFSCGGWVYMADWSTVAESVFISRSNNASFTNGWGIYFGTNETINIYNNAAVATACSTAHFSAGWHHIVLTYGGTGNLATIYVDGVVQARGATGTITAGGNLEVGSNATTYKLNGRIDEVFIHNATVLTADQVKKIYARSAKKFAVADANGNIAIPELNVASGVYTPTLTNTTNIDASTATAWPWTRIGDVITVYVNCTIDPTAAAPTNTVLTFTLPIACTSTPTLNGSASANMGTAVNQSGRLVSASATTGTLSFSAESAINASWGGSFSYVIN
jgi:hypothetical protein